MIYLSGEKQKSRIAKDRLHKYKLQGWDYKPLSWLILIQLYLCNIFLNLFYSWAGNFFFIIIIIISSSSSSIVFLCALLPNNYSKILNHCLINYLFFYSFDMQFGIGITF